MYSYIIIVPFVEQMREFLEEDKAAVVIMDNFKGQVTERIIELMESHNIHIFFIPPNTTDHLQPMDVAVNKPAKAKSFKCGMQNRSQCSWKMRQVWRM